MAGVWRSAARAAARQLGRGTGEASEWHELAVIESIARAVGLRAIGRPEVGALTRVCYIGEVLDALLEDERRLDSLVLRPPLEIVHRSLR